MAKIAVERLLRDRIDLMFGVIEIRLRHPAIDQDRFCDYGGSLRDSFHFMTKRAAGKISARGCAHRLLRFIRVLGGENGALELVAGMKLVA